jgi:hypothetical protein
MAIDIANNAAMSTDAISDVLKSAGATEINHKNFE